MRMLPFLVSLREKGDSRLVCNKLDLWGLVVFFLMTGLITANLKVLGTYPNDNEELIIAKRAITSGSTSFSSLDGIGSNIYVVGLVDLTS